MQALSPEPDVAVLGQLGRRLAQHRLEQNLTQAEVALDAGVSISTLARLERGQSTHLSQFVRVLRALGLLGELDALIPPPAPSPIARLGGAANERTGIRGPRRRASPRAPHPAQPWTWGED